MITTPHTSSKIFNISQQSYNVGDIVEFELSISGPFLQTDEKYISIIKIIKVNNIPPTHDESISVSVSKITEHYTVTIQLSTIVAEAETDKIRFKLQNVISVKIASTFKDTQKNL
jgi:NADH dehydrogenase FAD-containing subunit